MTVQNNPLLGKWRTPHGMPPFDDIEPDHFREAFEVAIASHCVEIEAIASQTAPPGFSNTIEALEKGGQLLRQVSHVFFNLSGADTNDLLQEIEREVVPKLARHRGETLLNAALFVRIETLVKTSANPGLSSEQARVLERYHTMFVRAGARLEAPKRARMLEIDQRLAVLGTQFSQNILSDEKAFELVLESEEELAGLPEFLRSSSARTARERGYQDRYVITLSRSSIEPFLQFSQRRDLREQAFEAWISRGETGGETDNREIVVETMALRIERAKLLGFDTFAAFKLDDQMAKTPRVVRDLLMQVWDPACVRAKRELGKLQDMVASQGGNFNIAPWDWRFYSEQVRKAEHDIDETEIKPYLQLDKIIEAAFDVANRLFGLRFEELKNTSAYHCDVRVFEVTDGAGDHVGIFLGDYFARPSKRSGAWMSAFRVQQKLTGDIRPIIVNVMNFSQGAEGEATLLTFDDARTLFHEFGHALHGLLSNVTYPLIAGTNVSRDFVELPSQLYEHWLSQPQVLRRYGVHYKTGEPMPQALVERLLAAENFNQGFATVEYVSSALVDLELHLLTTAEGLNVAEFERAVLERIAMPEQIVMRHRVPHFAHVFSGDGYSSGYYAYMWSEVMDADAFAAFEEAGDIFDPETADRLKRHIYAAGGKNDPAIAYKAFRGRLPAIDALLAKRGLTDTV